MKIVVGEIFVALICALLATSSTYPRALPQSTVDPPIKLSTDLVVFDAQVVSRKTGRNIGGLNEVEFNVYEDGVKQRITHFSRDRLPLSIVILVDVSESVWPGIDQIRAGALRALQHLKPEDEVALMAFTACAELVQNFTRDRHLIADRIRQIDKYKGNGTFIDEAVFQAATLLNKAANPDSRRVIIAITDNESNQPEGTGHSGKEATEMLFESGSVVCGLIVGPYIDRAGNPLKYYPPYFVLNKIMRKKRDEIRRRAGSISDIINPRSVETGGIVITAKRNQIVTQFTRLIEGLRNRYSFGYVSQNRNRDGTFRRIELNVSPNVVSREGRVAVITRKGYYARRPEAQDR
jgi:VWFA-related protein